MESKAIPRQDLKAGTEEGMKGGIIYYGIQVGTEYGLVGLQHPTGRYDSKILPFYTTAHLSSERKQVPISCSPRKHASHNPQAWMTSSTGITAIQTVYDC
jgi:hypothetical protein